MSQINQRLDKILAICEPVMTADRMQNIKIEVRDIKDILRINGEKNMEDILKELKLGPDFTAIMEAGKQFKEQYSEPKDEQKFIITYYNLSEFKGYLQNDLGLGFCASKLDAEKLSILDVPAVLEKLRKHYTGNDIFGLMSAPVEVEKPHLSQANEDLWIIGKNTGGNIWFLKHDDVISVWKLKSQATKHNIIEATELVKELLLKGVDCFIIPILQ